MAGLDPAIQKHIAKSQELHGRVEHGHAWKRNVSTDL